MLKLITIMYQVTMELLSLYLTYFLKVTAVIKTSLSKPVGFLLFAPTTVTIAYHTTIQKAILFLAVLLLVDFITGILSSRKRHLEFKRQNPELVLPSFISSEKLRMSLVKTITYMLIVFGVFFIERIFFIKSFKWERVTDLDLTGTLITIAICCGIELWSIVMENLKELGFDLEERFTTFVKGVRRIFGTVKNNDEGIN